MEAKSFEIGPENEFEGILVQAFKNSRIFLLIQNTRFVFRL
jgi:hypothetical protein